MHLITYLPTVDILTSSIKLCDSISELFKLGYNKLASESTRNEYNVL